MAAVRITMRIGCGTEGRKKALACGMCLVGNEMTVDVEVSVRGEIKFLRGLEFVWKDCR